VTAGSRRRIPVRAFGKARLRLLGIAAANLAFLYSAASAVLFVAMRQTPERFGAIMSNVPAIVMKVLPFKPLWMAARPGPLAPGDLAPDFTLPAVDRSRMVHLSEEYRERPVVLIFGSYT
jgi:hypothetical protein